MAAGRAAAALRARLRDLAPIQSPVYRLLRQGPGTVLKNLGGDGEPPLEFSKFVCALVSRSREGRKPRGSDSIAQLGLLARRDPAIFRNRSRVAAVRPALASRKAGLMICNL